MGCKSDHVSSSSSRQQSGNKRLDLDRHRIRYCTDIPTFCFSYKLQLLILFNMIILRDADSVENVLTSSSTDLQLSSSSSKLAGTGGGASKASQPSAKIDNIEQVWLIRLI